MRMAEEPMQTLRSAGDASAGGAAAGSGELFILSAPSAVGKTTLIRHLFEHHRDLAAGLAFSVSHTTRPPRRGEVQGRDYYFVSRREFDEMIAAGAFLEWAVVHGRHYGTSKAEVERLTAAGKDVLLDIDVQGACQILERRLGVPAIFVLPPSFEEMERRLRSRGLDDAEQMERRLLDAREEMRYFQSYEYVILNDDVERASAALAAIFLARRCRRDRMQSQIRRVLEGFPQQKPSGPQVPNPESSIDATDSREDR